MKSRFRVSLSSSLTPKFREPFFGARDYRYVNVKTQPQNLRVDTLLAVRCQLGERPAFDELIARWHEPLWRYLRRLSNSDDSASDLAQDTWIRVFRGIAKLREPAKLRSWLFGIARNVAMDRLRAQYSQGVQSEVNLEELAADAEDDLNLEGDFATLESGLAALPICERETLTLFYLRELSIEEISNLVGVPVGTVKSRLFRARQLLRRAIQGANT